MGLGRAIWMAARYMCGVACCAWRDRCTYSTFHICGSAPLTFMTIESLTLGITMDAGKEHVCT